MCKGKKTVAFIPVRGGSKSIPLKNVKIIAGKPLVCWSMEAAMNCKYIDDVYISTDSVEIKDVIENFLDESENLNKSKVRIIPRSGETSSDTASTESAMLEFADKYIFDNIILIQATSPLISSEDLANGIIKHKNYDSVLSVVRQKRFNWVEKEDGTAKPLNYNYMSRPRRQEFDGYLVENGAFYITKRELLLENQCRISGEIGIYEMSEYTYYEIDEKSDWIVVEKLLEFQNEKRKENGKEKEIALFNDLKNRIQKIKMILMDCDGVLTDAGMYYGASGEELKKFNTKDGMGIQLLREKGYYVGIITGEDTEIVKRRAEKLKVEEIYLGVHNKLLIVKDLMEKYHLDYSNIAYIGDDINDKAVIEAVGLGCCPADGMKEVQDICHYVTTCKGGQGAVRELAELIIKENYNGEML